MPSPQSWWADGGAMRATCRHWSFPVFVAVVAVVLQWAGLAGPLRYDRYAISHGQLWRLLTGNLVHLGWIHLLRDLCALFIIWFGFANVFRERDWAILFFVNALVVGGGLYLFVPSVQWYVGLSGILYGFVLAPGLVLWRSRFLLGTAMVVGTTALVLYGVLIGPLPGQDLGLGGKVIPQAHLFGLIGGALFVAVRLLRGSAGYRAIFR